MITNLRPILATHIVTLIIAADKDAVVTLTVLFRPNDDNKSGKSHTVQFTGSHEEIDAEGLVKIIGTAASKVTESGNTLAELEAQIAETKKEREAVLKAEKDALAKAKDKPKTKADDKDDTAAEPVVTRSLARPKPPTKASDSPPAAAPAAPVGLTPAVPLKPAAPAPAPAQSTAPLFEGL